MEKPMSIKTYLEGIYDYNYWANHRYLNAAESLTHEQLYRPQRDRSTSIHATFLHMLSTETIWLKRWQGEAPKQELSAIDFPTLMSIQDHWAQLEKQMHSFLAAQNEESLQNDLVCIGFNGTTFHLLLWQMMAHIPNHNTHHRSELASILTSMGITHPEDEAVQYFLIKSGQRKE
jgi:uncharacterized damage-inducible protein DinB